MNQLSASLGRMISPALPEIAVTGPGKLYHLMERNLFERWGFREGLKRQSSCIS
jgi:hypothetical protein